MDTNTDNTAPLFVYNHADIPMSLYAYNFAVLSCAKPLLFSVLASDLPTGIPFALTGIHIARGQTTRPDLFCHILISRSFGQILCPGRQSAFGNAFAWADSSPGSPLSSLWLQMSRAPRPGSVPCLRRAPKAPQTVIVLPPLYPCSAQPPRPFRICCPPPPSPAQFCAASPAAAGMHSWPLATAARLAPDPDPGRGFARDLGPSPFWDWPSYRDCSWS
jgi:hypothetical protein